MAITEGRVPAADLMGGTQIKRRRVIPTAWVRDLAQIARGAPLPAVTRADVTLTGHPQELGMMQLEQILGCSRSTAIKLLALELIPSTKGEGFTGAYKVKRSDVEDYALRIIQDAADSWNARRGEG